VTSDSRKLPHVFVRQCSFEATEFINAEVLRYSLCYEAEAC